MTTNIVNFPTEEALNEALAGVDLLAATYSGLSPDEIAATVPHNETAAAIEFITELNERVFTMPGEEQDRVFWRAVLDCLCHRLTLDWSE